jgi:hypothetical protein
MRSRTSPVTEDRRVRDGGDGAVQPQALQDQASTTIDQMRMVLPGIQVLFGFQLMVVFEPRFQLLSENLKVAHLTSLCLVVLAILLILTPPAYDRIAEQDRVSKRFVRIASLLMSVAMAVFAVALVLDLFVVAWIVTESIRIAYAVSVVAAAGFTVLWFVFPLWVRARRRRT